MTSSKAGGENGTFNISAPLSRKIASAEWGEGVVEQLAHHLAETQPGMRGFTRRNLFRMRQFYETYADDKKVTPLVTQLPWTHNFYLEALDRDHRKPHENPAIGMLLCATKDEEVVEYALSRSLSPAMVSEYQIQMPDKKLLKAKLHEFYQVLAPSEFPT
ncbi:MAG: PDDEXK nuclease domain-containing protein [Verrucomicrobiota bacterium]|nr:PDDEXK nuclease domain-containing protein [Verrucomicrobiota bacterium]